MRISGKFLNCYARESGDPFINGWMPADAVMTGREETGLNILMELEERVKG